MTNVSARLYACAGALAVAAVLCLSPAATHAAPVVAIVNIPFDFYVGAGKLPAGRYMVSHLSDPAVLRVYDGEGHVSVSFSIGISTSSTSNDAHLVFNRYGDQYFLSEVYWPGSSVARQLLKSSIETQIAKNSKPESVVAATNNK